MSSPVTLPGGSGTAAGGLAAVLPGVLHELRNPLTTFKAVHFVMSQRVAAGETASAEAPSAVSPAAGAGEAAAIAQHCALVVGELDRIDRLLMALVEVVQALDAQAPRSGLRALLDAWLRVSAKAWATAGIEFQGAWETVAEHQVAAHGLAAWLLELTGWGAVNLARGGRVSLIVELAAGNLRPGAAQDDRADARAGTRGPGLQLRVEVRTATTPGAPAARGVGSLEALRRGPLTVSARPAVEAEGWDLIVALVDPGAGVPSDSVFSDLVHSDPAQSDPAQSDPAQSDPAQSDPAPSTEGTP